MQSGRMRISQMINPIIREVSYKHNKEIERGFSAREW